jgi:hypothetical protein
MKSVENNHEIVRLYFRRLIMATPALSSPVIGYPEKRPVDLSDVETRRKLSPSAIRVFENIAGKWGLSESQIRSLLGGIASSTWHTWKSNPDVRVLDRDTMTRISLVIGIYKALHTYFNALADQWATLPNDGPLFAGSSPVDYIVNADIPEIYEVRKMLDSWSAGH